MEQKSRVFSWKEIILLGAVVLFAFHFRYFWGLLTNFLSVMSTFFFGAGIAYLLSRPAEYIRKWLMKTGNHFVSRFSWGFSVALIFILLIAAIIGIINVAVPVIIDNLLDFYSQFEVYITDFLRWLGTLQSSGGHYFIFDMNVIGDLISGLPIEEVVNQAGNALVALLNSTLTLGGLVIDIFLTLVFALYILFYKHRFVALMSYIGAVVFKHEDLAAIKGYVKKSNEIFYSFISAQFLDACILGALATLLLLVLNVRYAVTLGLLLGVANMIPKFGSIVATGGVVLVTLLTGGFSLALLTAFLLLVLQQIDGNIIGPWIMGDALGLNPAFVMLAILIGGYYHGVFGMFMAVPVAAILKILFFDFLDYYGKKRGISHEGLKLTLRKRKK